MSWGRALHQTLESLLKLLESHHLQKSSWADSRIWLDSVGV